MDNYINNYDSFNKIMIYNFNLCDGGLADCIRFFMVALDICIKNSARLYYQKNNIYIENYIKLKYDKMYIYKDRIKQLGHVEIVTPFTYYSTTNFNYSIDIKDVFYFTHEVKLNYEYLFPPSITNYISIHLRLGDKYLETEEQYIVCKGETRFFIQENIDKIIEKNYDKNIFFCCDNNNYKLKIKEKYNNIIIANCAIGHTGLSNTTKIQVLDAITELYILANSEMIFSASISGFPMIASKFNNIPLIQLCAS